jgi:Fe-S-cluster containining protein
LINLTEEEYKSGRFETMFDEFVPDFEEAEMVGANILKQKEDGSCFYLKDGKCSIHSIRPNSCRPFFCDSKDPSFKEMIDKIKEYKNQSTQ